MGKRQSKARSRSSRYREEGTSCLSPTEVALPDRPAHTDVVTSVAFLAPDWCVSGGKDKAVVVCNWHHGTVTRKFWGHEHDVTKVCCFSELGWLFSASRDRTAKMWDLHGGAFEAAQCFSGHELVVSGLAASPGEKALLAGFSHEALLCSATLFFSLSSLLHLLPLPPKLFHSSALDPVTTVCACGTSRQGPACAGCPFPGMW